MVRLAFGFLEVAGYEQRVLVRCLRVGLNKKVVGKRGGKVEQDQVVALGETRYLVLGSNSMPTK